jgi:hypothetical protein
MEDSSNNGDACGTPATPPTPDAGPLHTPRGRALFDNQLALSAQPRNKRALRAESPTAAGSSLRAAPCLFVTFISVC